MIILLQVHIIEGSDNTEILDRVEKTSENLDIVKEVITEVIENIPAVVIEETKDENNIKEIDLLRIEIKELKASIDDIVDILGATITSQLEVKKMVEKIPMRKGIITMGGIEEKKSSLMQQIENVTRNIL